MITKITNLMTFNDFNGSFHLGLEIIHELQICYVDHE
jgi:hypothetical protein